MLATVVVYQSGGQHTIGSVHAAVLDVCYNTKAFIVHIVVYWSPLSTFKKPSYSPKVTYTVTSLGGNRCFYYGLHCETYPVVFYGTTAFLSSLQL